MRLPRTEARTQRNEAQARGGPGPGEAPALEQKQTKTLTGHRLSSSGLKARTFNKYIEISCEGKKGTNLDHVVQTRGCV